MFSWQDRHCVDGNMSKADILRGIVNEKLATAAREILAVVERTVSGYEEEIDRQRRQLEAFQPKVKLERPDTEDQEVTEQRDEEPRQQSGAEDMGGLGVLCCEEDEEEDEERSALSSRRSRDEDPDYQMPSRSFKGTVKKRKRGPCRLRRVMKHTVLRVRLLEDSPSRTLSKTVLTKSPVRELRCPRGLQEAEFLDLLRSTFPQLAAGQRFDVFTADSSRKLQPLKLGVLTPEEIRSAVGSTGAGNPSLYIRLKTTKEEVGSSKEEIPFFWKTDVGEESSCRSAVQNRDEAGLCASVDDDEVDQTSSARNQEDVETEEGDNGDDRGPSDPMDRTETHADTSRDGGEESGKGDGDWEPGVSEDRQRTDSVLQSSRVRNKKRSRTAAPERIKIHCRICGVFYKFMGSLIKHAWTHVGEAERLCGACGERFRSEDELGEHLKSHQKTYECSYCGKSFSRGNSLNQHVAVHTGHGVHTCDVCQKAFPCKSMLRTHQWVHVTDKPHKCEVCQKAFGLTSQLKAHRRIHTDQERFHCKVCGKSVYDRKSLIRHQATHKDERRYGCQVCGKHFKLLQTLRDHEKIHTVRERPYLCHVCCKTFIAKSCLNLHIKTHSQERPHVCKVCNKGCLTQGALRVHARVHSGETPYSCSQCARPFKNKNNLKNHMMTHTGVKLFFCGVCGKGVARQEHLTVHMRTHNGERPYQCTRCDKAFTQSHCLKTHMKTHQVADESTSSQQDRVQGVQSSLC